MKEQQEHEFYLRFLAFIIMMITFFCVMSYKNGKDNAIEASSDTLKARHNVMLVYDNKVPVAVEIDRITYKLKRVTR